MLNNKLTTRYNTTIITGDNAVAGGILATLNKVELRSTKTYEEQVICILYIGHYAIALSIVAAILRITRTHLGNNRSQKIIWVIIISLFMRFAQLGHRYTNDGYCFLTQVEDKMHKLMLGHQVYDMKPKNITKDNFRHKFFTER